MSVCLYPGFVFDAAIPLTDRAGNPVNWPDGMTVRIRVITGGTGSPVLLFADGQVITGSWMYLHLADTETLQVPRGAEIFLDVDYGDGWRPWRRGRVGRCN
jgi:hypothetical protein